MTNQTQGHTNNAYPPEAYAFARVSGIKIRTLYASPELLEALKDCIDCLVASSPEAKREMIKQAKQAIAKAEGRG